MYGNYHHILYTDNKWPFVANNLLFIIKHFLASPRYNNNNNQQTGTHILDK